MGRAFPRRGRRWFERSLVTTSFIAKPNGACRVRSRRGLAAAALYRQADRRRDRRVAGHHQPHSAAARPQPALGAGAGRAGAPLRARAPGELIHLDIKKLGKFNRIGHRITGDRTGQSNQRAGGQGPGWEYVHVCIDDASRVAFSRIMKDEKQASAVAFLKAAVAYYASLGVTVERVMTDNGACYISRAFRSACKRLRLKQIRTKPYTPKTNGKAERFIQTSLREWAYAQAYNTSKERAAELPRWLHRYNWHRPHASIGSMPPISKIALTENNLLRLHN